MQEANISNITQDWLAKHPHASYEELKAFFLQVVEGHPRQTAELLAGYLCGQFCLMDKLRGPITKQNRRPPHQAIPACGSIDCPGRVNCGRSCSNR
jgi:hypothetical protein